MQNRFLVFFLCVVRVKLKDRRSSKCKMGWVRFVVQITTRTTHSDPQCKKKWKKSRTRHSWLVLSTYQIHCALCEPTTTRWTNKRHLKKNRYNRNQQYVRRRDFNAGCARVIITGVCVYIRFKCFSSRFIRYLVFEQSRRTLFSVRDFYTVNTDRGIGKS